MDKLYLRKYKGNIILQNTHTFAGDPMFLMVGSYATPQEEGIKVYAWDSETGEATYVSGLTGISNPSSQVVSADGSHVYSVGEDDGETSAAHALSFDRVDGKLTLMNTQFTQEGAPCYINLSPKEDYVMTANYAGGTFPSFRWKCQGV